jgi:hypothetical protein
VDLLHVSNLQALVRFTGAGSVVLMVCKSSSSLAGKQAETPHPCMICVCLVLLGNAAAASVQCVQSTCGGGCAYVCALGRDCHHRSGIW